MSNQKIYHFSAQVYYEDTDHSGVVYHPNYFKFFERAREDIIGVETLSRLWHGEQIGFAVYKTQIQYHEGAVFGDILDIQTTWEKESPYRLIFRHRAFRPHGKKPAVTCDLHLVCLGREKKLIPIPDLAFLKELYNH